MDPAAARARMDQLFPKEVLDKPTTKETFKKSKQNVNKSTVKTSYKKAKLDTNKSLTETDKKSLVKEEVDKSLIETEDTESFVEEEGKNKFLKCKSMSELFEIPTKLSDEKKTVKKVKSSMKKTKSVVKTLGDSDVAVTEENSGKSKVVNNHKSSEKSPPKKSVVKLSKSKLSEITSSRPQLSICPVKKKNKKSSKKIKVDKPFICEKCDFRSNYKGSLKEHMAARHSKKRPYACMFCTYKASRRPDLTKHVLIVHEGHKPYNCGYCEYKTSHSAALKRHINALHTHHEIHSCEHCPFTAARKYNLTNHIALKHPDKAEGIKLLYCGDCNYTSLNKSLLKSHILSKHMNEKPFACPYMNCKVATSGKSTLTRHIAEIHSGIKRHKCTDCNYSSNRLSRIKEHFANKHSNRSKTFSCVFCPYSTNKSSNLEVHIVKKHQNVERETQIDLSGLNLIVSTSMATQNMNVKVDQNSSLINIPNFWSSDNQTCSKESSNSNPQNISSDNESSWDNQSPHELINHINQNVLPSKGMSVPTDSQNSNSTLNNPTPSILAQPSHSESDSSTNSSKGQNPSGVGKVASSFNLPVPPSETRTKNSSNAPPTSTHSMTTPLNCNKQTTSNRFHDQNRHNQYSNPISPSMNPQQKSQIRSSPIDLVGHNFYDPSSAKSSFPPVKLNNSSTKGNHQSSNQSLSSLSSKSHLNRDVQNFPNPSGSNKLSDFSQYSPSNVQSLSQNPSSPIPLNLPHNSFMPTTPNFYSNADSYQYFDRDNTEPQSQNFKPYGTGLDSTYKAQQQWGVSSNPPNWGMNYPP